ncbi:MAG: hypothetical protein JSU04_05450 [Bdellovibrionales bacterium]|nr:hypothetical protein [Bdellovibrionales bacterium]
MKKMILFLGLLGACASQPKVEKPVWLTQPTRIVDNGYIVYVGSAEDGNAERAQFKAEGLALEDLANECSFIPKGARIEDRYSEKDKYFTKAYVKIGLEFAECEKAKHANDPATIREIANTSFTEQIRRYQDLSETGDMPDPAQYAALEVPPNVEPMPSSAGMSESTHFYVVRQYVAYQKETVILSPPTMYAANSPEAQHWSAAIQPAVTQVQTYQSKNPVLETKPEAWSHLADHPKLPRPETLMASRPAPRAVYKPVKTPKGAHVTSGVHHDSGGGKKKKRKKHSS